MIRTTCYIDNQYCTGARFSFCDACKKAQEENEDAILRAVTPAEVTAAHVPKNK